MFVYYVVINERIVAGPFNCVPEAEKAKSELPPDKKVDAIVARQKVN